MTTWRSLRPQNVTPAKSSEASRVAGFLTITALKDGEVVRTSGRLPNKVVNGSGYGRNLIARRLAGDQSFGIEIDSAGLGDSNTAAADAQTDLISPILVDIPITNSTATGDTVTIDVFVADANLPNGTYREFAVYCAGRLFARVVISPDYTKSAGEDTLFTYELNLT